MKFRIYGIVGHNVFPDIDLESERLWYSAIGVTDSAVPIYAMPDDGVAPLEMDLDASDRT